MVLTFYNKFVTQGSDPVELVPTNHEKLSTRFVRSNAYFGQLAVQLRQLADVADDAIPRIADVPVEVHCKIFETLCLNINSLDL